MMVGALSHATIFGHVTNIVQRIYARRSEYEAKWRDLKHFTEVHNVPKQLKQRMQDYFQTVWSINHGIDVSQVLTDYPEELRGDVSLHLHKEVLSLPLFQSATQGCLKSMSLTIKTSFCAPDEFLVHSGDVVQNIFYLSSGSMEVVQEGMVVALLGKGDLVGCDIPIQKMSDTGTTGVSSTNNPVVKSSADVRALTYCFLECIQVPELLQVLKLHTDFRDQFANDIQHDLTYNLREGFEQDDDEVLLHRSRLPSISEQSDVSGEREVTLKSPVAQSGSSTGSAELQINRIKMEMSTLMGRLEKLSENSSGVRRSGQVANSETANKSVQTEFPVSLLGEFNESYVVKNRSRILSLLNIAEPSSPSDFSLPVSNGSCQVTASVYNEKKVAVTDF